MQQNHASHYPPKQQYPLDTNLTVSTVGAPNQTYQHPRVVSTLLDHSAVVS